MHTSAQMLQSKWSDLFQIQPQHWLSSVTGVQLALCPEESARYRFISCMLMSLSTMLHLEMPHVNVLSKIDLIRQYGKLGGWEGLVEAWVAMGNVRKHIYLA